MSSFAENSEKLFVNTSSAVMRAVERTIQDIAETDSPVLVIGESGTGKDVVALRIHQLSGHKHEPFMKMDCSALPADFFIGNGPGPNAAYSRRLMTRGTVYLDKVEELNTLYQSNLLYALSDDERVPAKRVISSARTNLEQEMCAGRFREDLYYRLGGVCLNLPPLRHRQEDIPALVEFFLVKYTALFLKPKLIISEAGMQALLAYSWPGNIRELEYIIQQILDLGNEVPVIADLRSQRRQLAIAPADRISLKETGRAALRQAERELILRVLARTRWNRKRAAEELQISYKALLYKLKQMDFDSAGSRRKT